MKYYSIIPFLVASFILQCNQNPNQKFASDEVLANKDIMQEVIKNCTYDIPVSAIEDALYKAVNKLDDLDLKSKQLKKIVANKKKEKIEELLGGQLDALGEYLSACQETVIHQHTIHKQACSTIALAEKLEQWPDEYRQAIESLFKSYPGIFEDMSKVNQSINIAINIEKALKYVGINEVTSIESLGIIIEICKKVNSFLKIISLEDLKKDILIFTDAYKPIDENYFLPLENVIRLTTIEPFLSALPPYQFISLSLSYLKEKNVRLKEFDKSLEKLKSMLNKGRIKLVWNKDSVNFFKAPLHQNNITDIIIRTEDQKNEFSYGKAFPDEWDRHILKNNLLILNNYNAFLEIRGAEKCLTDEIFRTGLHKSYESFISEEHSSGKLLKPLLQHVHDISDKYKSTSLKAQLAKLIEKLSHAANEGNNDKHIINKKKRTKKSTLKTRGSSSTFPKHDDIQDSPSEESDSDIVDQKDESDSDIVHQKKVESVPVCISDQESPLYTSYKSWLNSNKSHLPQEIREWVSNLDVKEATDQIGFGNIFHVYDPLNNAATTFYSFNKHTVSNNVEDFFATRFSDRVLEPMKIRANGTGKPEDNIHGNNPFAAILTRLYGEKIEYVPSTKQKHRSQSDRRPQVNSVLLATFKVNGNTKHSVFQVALNKSEKVYHFVQKPIPELMPLIDFFGNPERSGKNTPELFIPDIDSFE